MNQVIQSLVQSPWVRTMSAIPSKSEELVHGVENFLPPLSRSIVRIPPKTGRVSDDVYQFDIPRRDYLDRMELVFRPRNPSSEASITLGNVTVASTDALSSQTIVSGTLQAKNQYSNMITDLELYSKNRFIERLDPDAIYHECNIRNLVSASGGGGLNYHFTYSTGPTNNLTGAVADASSLVFPFRSAKSLTYAQTTQALRFSQFHLPLPFCAMSMLKKNFQTNFLETLTLAVKTRFCRFYQQNPTGYEMELVCYYHQFHSNVETVIRNANYKPGIPATLPWWEYVRCTNRVSQSASLIRYLLDSDLLVSEILISPSFRSSSHFQTAWEWTRTNFYIVLTSNNEVIYEGDAARSTQDQEYVLQDNESHMLRTHQEDGPMLIRLGLQYGEIFTGGISLASMNNVLLSIYPSQGRYLGISGDEFPVISVGNTYDSFDVNVIMKRHYMLRIDSDTGTVSRSIES